jgi:hypothetical protein
MPVDGSCPRCHRSIAPSQTDGSASPAGRAARRARAAVPTPEGAPDVAQVADDERTKVPWHFWVMVAAVGGYLGWRLIQGVVWVGQQIFG